MPLALRVGKSFRLGTLALVALLDGLTDGLFVPHSRGGVMSLAIWIWWLLTRVQYRSSIDWKALSLSTVVMLSQAVLESTLNAFVHILGHVATTVSHHIGVTAGPVAEILQSCGVFVCGQSFHLMTLISVKRCGVLCWLVSGPRGRAWHIGVAYQATITCNDVGVATHTITPVRRVLNVLCARQLLRKFHLDWMLVFFQSSHYDLCLSVCPTTSTIIELIISGEKWQNKINPLKLLYPTQVNQSINQS